MTWAPLLSLLLYHGNKEWENVEFTDKSDVMVILINFNKTWVD